MKSNRIEKFLATFFSHFAMGSVSLCGFVLFSILPMSTFMYGQQKTTRVMTGSAKKDNSAANLKIASDLPQRLAKFRRVEMPFQKAGLSSREVQLVHKLVEACGYLESIYWRQSDPD